MLEYKFRSAFLLFFGILLWSVSCKTRYPLDEEALKNYVLDVDNGLTLTKEKNNIKVSVTNRPTGLLMARELPGRLASEKVVKELQLKYDDHYYFVVSLSKEGKELLYQANGGYNDFSDRLRTLAFRMPQYLNMTTATDTIPISDYVFPRTYGMGGATELLVVFEKSKTKEKEWVQLNLNEFGFGLGNIRFRFRVKDLESVPKLKIITV